MIQSDFASRGDTYDSAIVGFIRPLEIQSEEVLNE